MTKTPRARDLPINEHASMIRALRRGCTMPDEESERAA